MMPTTFLGHVISNSMNSHASKAYYVLLTDEEMETCRRSTFSKANQINETFGLKFKPDSYILVSLFLPPR